MIRDLGNLIVIAVLMFGLAYLFVEGWDAQHKIDQQNSARRMDQMLGIVGHEYGHRMPEIFAGGRETTTGYGYYDRRAERGR